MILPLQPENTGSLYVPSYNYGFGPLPAPGTTNMLGQGINPPGDLKGPPPGGLAQPPPVPPPPGRPIPIFPVPGGTVDGHAPPGQQQPGAANVNVNIFGAPSMSYPVPAPIYGLYRIGLPSASLSL